MNHSHRPHEPSLIDVQVAFEHWRTVRIKRQPTPKHLRALAVTLLEQHLPSAICKALGINDTALKQWAKEEPVVNQGSFVVLPEEPQAEKSNPAEANRCVPRQLLCPVRPARIIVAQQWSDDSELTSARFASTHVVMRLG